jgi:hypothetical protein
MVRLAFGTRPQDNDTSEEVQASMDCEITDVELLRDNLVALRGAAERAQEELARAQAAAEAAFLTGSPGDTAAALERVRQVRDRLAGLQQQRTAAEGRLRAAIQPEVDAWAASCQRDGEQWAAQVTGLVCDLGLALDKLEATLDALGALPEGRTRLLRRWGEGWDSVTSEAPELGLQRPEVPGLPMPNVAAAMNRLAKLADDYARPGPVRPNLADFLTTPR